MRSCTHCDAKLEKGESVCPHCGHEQYEQVKTTPRSPEEGPDLTPKVALASPEEKRRWLRREARDATRILAQSVLTLAVFVAVGGVLGWLVGGVTGMIVGALLGAAIRFVVL